MAPEPDREPEVDEPSPPRPSAGGLRALRTPTGEVTGTRPPDMEPAPTARPFGRHGHEAATVSAAPTGPRVLGLPAAVGAANGSPPPTPMPAPPSVGAAGSALNIGPWDGQPRGWATQDPGRRYSPATFTSAEESRGGVVRVDRSSAGNIGWVLLGAAVSCAVVGVALTGIWYRRTVHGATTRVSVTLVSPAKLLAPGYGEWRLVVPAAAGALVLASLLGAAIWRSARYPSVYIFVLRALALSVVAATVAALIVRTPHYDPAKQTVVGALEAHGASFGYLLSWAGWVTLPIAVVALLAYLPLTSRLR